MTVMVLMLMICFFLSYGGCSTRNSGILMAALQTWLFKKNSSYVELYTILMGHITN